MADEDKYSPGHSKCRESLICMINKKLSKNIAVAVALAVIGIPSGFVIYGMAAEKKQNEIIANNDKKIDSYSIKQNTILFNQTIFRQDVKDMKAEHKKEMEKLHDKMEGDKKDIIKEMRRLYRTN